MRTLADTCSLINLHNAGLLEQVARLQSHRLVICPSVILECGVELAQLLAELRAEGLIEFFDIDLVPGDRYLELLSAYNLGDGETECIAIGEIEDLQFCCDDRRARMVAGGLLGPERILGSLRLLRCLVTEDAVSCGAAYVGFEEMKRAGGFLPEIPKDFFCAVA